MLKKTRSINDLIKEVFYWNTRLGNLVLVAVITAITFWFLWSDQKTGCTVALSIFNQYKNSISRELELENPTVAQANFTAFVKELNNLGLTNNLSLTGGKLIDNSENTITKCSVNLVSANINIPLQFASKISGTITGNISYFPSILALLAVWMVTIFLITSLRRIESGIKVKLLKDLISPIKILSTGDDLAHNSEYPIEVNDINTNFKSLRAKIISSEKSENDVLRAHQLNLLASQVSHDIRSPLSALSLITNQLSQIPEDKRIIIRSAVNRINDIANQLLQKGKEIQSTSTTSMNARFESAKTIKLSTHLLSPLIDSIVSEKRIQFREKQSVDIEADINQSYGLFANINATELKRTISNLVNNAIEAFPNEIGKVTVGVKKNTDDQVAIIIQDNGKGIPEHILKKLGEMGVSHGKEGTQGGSGLGVYHAKKTVEVAGGIFLIESREGAGTTITMTFSKAPAPKWFVEKLILPSGMIITSLDDDISIHQIWKGRFESKNVSAFGIEHRTFTAGSDFKSWVISHNIDNATESTRLYLVDYELLNQNATGLDIIEELGIGAQAILVTSRYEEDKIRERCDRLGVRLIPKAMAGFVPIEIAKPKELVDGILLDDDFLVHSCWKIDAESRNKKFIGFQTVGEFFARADEFDFSSPLFVDSNLGSGIKGEEVSKRAFELGFKNVYLCTGYEPDSFPAMPWLKGIKGKDPCFL